MLPVSVQPVLNLFQCVSGAHLENGKLVHFRQESIDFRLIGRGELAVGVAVEPFVKSSLSGGTEDAVCQGLEFVVAQAD